MSDLHVEVCRIESVEKHPNADRLDLIKLRNKDWQIVTAKDNFKVNDFCVYFPIDSILPVELETKIFGIDSKIKLSNSRVKTIKLRGAISQGMCVKFETLGFDPIWHKHDEGTDLTKELGVTKYEPILASTGNTLANGHKSTKKQTNPHFRKYTSIDNAKNYPRVFEEKDEVVVTCKIHGSNFRSGYVPYHANNWWKKFKQYIGLTPKYEFVYGSHHVQLQHKLRYKGFYKTNIYAEMVVKYALTHLLKPGEVVYGEVYGDGVQKGYTYGCKQGERKLIVFDVRINDEWLDPIFAKKWCNERGLDYVPILYTGPFNKEKILALRDGPSVLCPEQKVREGIVVRSVVEEQCYIGRKILKFISDEYLLKNQDDETIAH